MSSEPSIEQRFAELVALDTPAEREEYFRRVCGDDEALRQQLEKLLEAHDQAGAFMEDEEPEDTIDRSAMCRPGSAVGPYKLMEQIGEGGMGVVFVAEQERPIRRKVALKVIKPGMDSKSIVARFEAERQALAVMDHPNIAKVLDAGTTENGHPFFVMELVCGIEITKYCDEHKLTIRERLGLFNSICHAIQHAHQKGIIHRDIKPSNVLVTEQDGKAIAKVIDFGVAKAVGGQTLSERTVYTSFLAVIGTPLYMSPEQAALSNVDVDTRSDVYSLGVLLYELVTGTTPFDKETLKRAAQDEVLRIIREQEPQKPSTKISTMGKMAESVSQSRRTDLANLGKTVRGDLDWIVMKALAKDRTRRYDSPSRFAADIDCFLENAAIEARPPSTWYQLQKAFQRHKALAVATLTILFALAVGLGVALWGLKQARSGWNRARATAAELREERDKIERLLNKYEPLVLNEIYDAVFSGDIDTAMKAIEDAEAVGVGPEKLAVLRAIQQIFSGEQESYRDGLRSFERMLETDEDDVIALSVLTWSLATGYGDLDVFARIGQRHRDLVPPEDDREKVIWAIGLSVEGNFRGISNDGEAIVTARQTLETIVEDYPSWKLPRLMLARVLADFSVDRRDPRYVTEAIDVHLPKILATDSDLLRSPYWLAQRLHIFNVGVRLTEGDERVKYRKEADSLADALIKFGHRDYIFGRLERAFYFTNIAELDGATDFSRAIEEWLVVNQQSENDLYGSLYGGLAVRVGLITGDWTRAKEHYEGYPLPFTAYFQGDRDATLELCSRLKSGETQLGEFWTHAVLHTCGGEERIMARRYFEKLRASGEYPPWIDLPLQLFLGETNAEDVAPSESKNHQAWAYQVTGNYLVNDGREAEALSYFDRVIEADSYMMDVHQWAHAFWLRIEKDPDWYQRMNPESVAE